MKRLVLVISQVAVVLVALGVRFAAPGWWLAIVVMSFGIVAAVVLAPMLVAGTIAISFAPSLRLRTLAALAVADLALLVFTLALPDFTDQYDDHLVPLAALATGDGNVSAGAATVFESIAGWSVLVYLVASIAVLVLAALDHSRPRAVRSNQRIEEPNWPDPYRPADAVAAIAVTDSGSASRADGPTRAGQAKIKWPWRSDTD
ncbi:hypothetical protein [Nocardia sp. NPDC051981]|uniref:hypothetical protein n=1 Tax=Nocardia sp. NPDC051981 TaxID=3155417 RepID=UPI003415D79E